MFEDYSVIESETGISNARVGIVTDVAMSCLMIVLLLVDFKSNLSERLDQKSNEHFWVN